MIIRKAEQADAKEIYAIASANSIEKIIDKEQQGFLVSEYSMDYYIRLIHTNECFLVLEEKGVVKAFLVLFTRKETNKDTLINRRMLEMSNDFVIVKQVCVEENCRRMGYAELLYKEVMKQFKCDIYSAVVLEPRNEASLKFHDRLGFKQACTTIAEDGLKRVIMVLERARESTINAMAS